MRKSKKLISGIGLISVVLMIVSILFEFRIIPFVEEHRGFIVNMPLGLSCSGLVVVLSEYIEYKMLSRGIRYNIDYELRTLRRKLEEADKLKSLYDIVEYRNNNLAEYIKCDKFSTKYFPFWFDRDKKRYNKKILILDIDVWELFFNNLEVLARADSEKRSNYYELLSRVPETELEKANNYFEAKDAKKWLDKHEKSHLQTIKGEIGGLLRKVNKFIED